MVRQATVFACILIIGCGGSDEPAPACGNGALDDGEVCDDGRNDGRYGGCNPGCASVAPRCGDGVVDSDIGEACDDGVNDFLGGGCFPGCRVQDLTAEIFQNVLDIEITMDPDDWDAMRHQRKTRHTIFGSADCRSQVIENPYTYFAGTVTIDGQPLPNTGLRKKGHLGSQSTLKPSLKLRFDEFINSQHYKSIRRLSLNNSKSDATYARTCLAYATFAAAGLPAPRCTYAHVTVNEQDLGVYFVTEEIKKPFLRRHFADASGTLYEGTACDFRPEFIGGFEQETNEADDDTRADLRAIYDVVQDAPDDTFEAALGELINLFRFYRFWAVESLIWHRDGYSGNANNYFMYADPADDGRFAFLPWGPDAAFRADNRSHVPDSVLAFGAITHRLYNQPDTRERFYDELGALLDQVWSPEAAVAELDRVAQAITPLLSPDEQITFPGAVSEMQGVITDRRAVIEAVIADGFPDWTAGMRTLPCRDPMTAISGNFSTTWDTLSQNIYTAGTGTLDVTLDDQVLQFVRIGTRAGALNSGLGRLQLTAETADRRYSITTTFPDPKFFEPFMTVGEHELIGPPVSMNVVERDISVTPNVVLRRFEIGEGTWTFEQVGETPGAPIVGSFQGTLYLRVL